MPLRDYVTGTTNRLLIGTGGIGLIIAAITSLASRTPALQVRGASSQLTWNVDIAGRETASGAYTNKTLANCDTIDGTSTGMLVCGTDATGAGGGGSTNTGGVLDAGNSRFVNISGDTMTGSLINNVNITTKGTLSGNYLYAGTMSGAGLIDCDTATTSKLLWDATTRRYSCGTDTDTTYTAGQGLTLNSTAFSTNGTITGTLIRFQTLSGFNVFALNKLRSSGGLVVEGAMSGVSLTVSNLNASSCDVKSSVNGVLSCGSDAGSSYTAGQGLTLVGSAFNVDSTLTGTLVRFQTLSGFNVFALNKLRSSGGLIVEGTMSGLSLVVSNLNAAGCDVKSSVTGVFSCGSDADTNTVTAVGQGLSLNSGLLTLTASHSGSTINATTLSGLTVYAKSQLRSSGSLVVEGSMSGFSMTISNLNAASCDVKSSVNGVLSCGSDANTNIITAIGQGLSLNSGLLTLTASHSGSTITATTLSGLTVFAKSKLRSSGGLVVEGAMSGFTLTVSGLNGANCDVKSSVNGVLSCGTDADTTYTAGQGLTLSTTMFKTNATLTGTTVRFTTLSGYTVSARTVLVSSGALAVKGTSRLQGTLSGNLIRGTVSCASLGMIYNSGSLVLGSGANISATFPIPAIYSGWLLTSPQADVDTSGTTNATKVTIRQPDKAWRYMLSTPISIDSATKTSLKSSTPPVVNASQRDVGAGESLSVDVVALSTTAPKNLKVLIRLCAP